MTRSTGSWIHLKAQVLRVRIDKRISTIGYLYTLASYVHGRCVLLSLVEVTGIERLRIAFLALTSTLQTFAIGINLIPGKI
jgi:hypothetical protein